MLTKKIKNKKNQENKHMLEDNASSVQVGILNM